MESQEAKNLKKYITVLIARSLEPLEHNYNTPKYSPSTHANFQLIIVKRKVNITPLKSC